MPPKFNTVYGGKNAPCEFLSYILYDTVKQYRTRKCDVFPENQHICKCDIEFIQQFSKQVHIVSYIFALFFSPILPTKIDSSKAATKQLCVSEQHTEVFSF